MKPALISLSIAAAALLTAQAAFTTAELHYFVITLIYMAAGNLGLF
jgi:hypothetical protein